MPTKDIEVEEQTEISEKPAVKRRKQNFRRAVKRNYQRHDIGQKTR
tara:strand:+ start:24607 stop:24744 length:138 start_codon:yes stop_codon:yes gene_type:complete